jgi:uncharacterized protein YkwD
VRTRAAGTVMVLACGVAAAPAAARPTANASQLDMVAAVNGVRAAHGLARLRHAPVLERSARAYAGWMLRANYFGHRARIQTSRAFRVLGETLAWHSGRQALVHWTLRAWLRSPAHRAVILHRPFRWLGAGIRRGRFKGMPATMWVLHMGG